MIPTACGALTRGPIPRHVRALAVPAAVAMLFNTLYNVIDIFFAGLLSTSAQAGLALGYQALFIAMSASVGLAAAMSALVGHALGRRDRAEAGRLIAQGLVLGALAAVALVMTGAWYGPRVIEAVSEPGAYRAEGIRYYLVVSLALPGFLIAYACNGILQAHGDGRSMQRALVVAFFANVGLNPLCIFGLPGLWSGFGFDGLAISTVLSQTGVMLYMLHRVRRLSTLQEVVPRHCLPDARRFREIGMQAMPTSVAFLVMILSAFVVQFALKGIGEHAIAGYGIAIRLEQILLLPIFGVTSALLPIAAQNHGAGQPERVRAAFWTCARIGLAMSALAFPVMWLAGPALMALFSSEAEVIHVGVLYLRVESFLLPAYMMLFLFNGLLQALQHPVWTLWISLYRQAFGIALFTWLFVGLLDMGVLGVWLGVACAVVTGFVFGCAIASGIAARRIGGLWRGAALPAAE